jgi:hypothetical protein
VKRSERRDVLWGAIAALMAVSFVGVVAQVLWQLAHGKWWVLIVVPVHLAFAWWIGVGAWRRTRWGQPPRVIHDMSTIR